MLKKKCFALWKQFKYILFFYSCFLFCFETGFVFTLPAWCHNDDFWNWFLDFKSKIKICWTNHSNCCASTTMQRKPQYCHMCCTVPETPLNWRCATKLLWSGYRPHNLTSHAELPHGSFITWLIVSSHLLPILCSYWLTTLKVYGNTVFLAFCYGTVHHSRLSDHMNSDGLFKCFHSLWSHLLLTDLSAWSSAAHSRVHNPLIEPAVKDVIALGWSMRKISRIHTAYHSFS